MGNKQMNPALLKALCAPVFHERLDRLEQMDDPNCDTDLLYRTLDQFKLTNILFSRSRGLMLRHMFREMEQAPGRQFSFLDLGAGGGDLSLWLHHTAKKRKLKLKITSLDYDPRIIVYLRTKFASYPQIKVRQQDVLDINPEQERFDFVFSNHLLHHLQTEDIPEFIRHMCRMTKRVLIFNDLKRSKWSYLGFALYGALFLHRSFSYRDGLLSIQRSFVKADFERMAAEIPEFNLNVGTCHPGRLYLIGRFTSDASIEAKTS